MKIITYNVNGLRSVISKGFLTWLAHESPDIICLQEIKATPEQVNVKDFESLGYKHFWFPAQKKGYSGVAIFAKPNVKGVSYGMNIPEYDFEGRFLRVDFEAFSVVSVYHPSGTSGEERQAFKMKWLGDFTQYLNQLRNEIPNLIVCGDYNICRLWHDIHNPTKQQHLSGFLPEEREWFAKFTEQGYTDAFRLITNEAGQYTWWSMRGGARERNLGWRIDYHIITNNLENKVINSTILSDIKFSDHCPVTLEIDL